MNANEKLVRISEKDQSFQNRSPRQLECIHLEQSGEWLNMQLAIKHSAVTVERARGLRCDFWDTRVSSGICAKSRKFSFAQRRKF
ncbi:hypothetical protein CEXT_758191 [Caerostris extrusa]|uniref:Uncharacterized protein n=1 Tax=Caerostris extrusa TaxID=172846 RepID=A0AAV4Q1Z2_CAEEX|nr:hypothetical protein CEXT_758191 [Caerostris extrusa]